MLIAFDWDGTLADSASYIAQNLSKVALEFGLPEPRAAEVINGLGLSPEAQLERLFPGQVFDVKNFWSVLENCTMQGYALDCFLALKICWLI